MFLQLFVGAADAVAPHHRLNRLCQYFPIVIQILVQSLAIGIDLAQAPQTGLVGEQRMA